MSDSETDGMTIRASHPPVDAAQRQRAWVAVDRNGTALGVFVTFFPAPHAQCAYDLHLYVVESARHQGLAKRLVRWGRDALAAEEPPIELYFNGIATEEGYAVGVSVGLQVHPRSPKRHSPGLEYVNYDRVKAVTEGLAALREAAARLGIPVAGPN